MPIFASAVCVLSTAAVSRAHSADRTVHPLTILCGDPITAVLPADGKVLLARTQNTVEAVALSFAGGARSASAHANQHTALDVKARQFRAFIAAQPFRGVEIARGGFQTRVVTVNALDRLVLVRTHRVLTVGLGSAATFAPYYA